MMMFSVRDDVAAVESLGVEDPREAG